MRVCTMHSLALAAAVMLPCSAWSAAPAADTPVGKLVAPAEVFNDLLSGEEQEFVGAAEAMPADKFNFAPPASAGTFTGVRTFSAEIKHVTVANYNYFKAFNVPGGKTRDEIEKLTDRGQILDALKGSFQYAHAAISTITPENAFTALNAKGATRAGLAAGGIAHPQDHYGQMVEYLRMNGVVPPASRK